jgi:hypothetical protein
MNYFSILSLSLSLFLSLWVLTQGLVLARQLLYYLSHAPSPLAFSLLFRSSLLLCLIQPWTAIFLSLPLQDLGLQV